MKISVNRKLFINELKDVKKGAYFKSQNVNKNCVKIVAGLDNIELTVFGDQSELIKKIDNCNIKDLGGVLIDLHPLLKILPKLQGDNIVIKTGNDNVTITSGKTVFTLNIGVKPLDDSLADMPEPKKNKITVGGKEFKKALKSSIQNVSKMLARPVIMGVNFKVRNNRMEMAATDSHQLFVNKLSIINKNHDNFNMLIYGYNLKIFYQLMNNKKDVTIKNQKENKNIGYTISQFSQDNLKMRFKNIEGKYPGIEQCIPSNYNSSFTVNRLQFQKAIRQARAISMMGRNNVCYLDFNPIADNILVGVDNNQVGKIQTKVRVHNISGKSIRITFNPDYVLNSMNAYVGYKNLNIKFLSPLRPFKISPYNDKTANVNNDKINIITPVRTF